MTLTRETAIDALRALASADAMIRDAKGTSNQFRTDTIAEMENQLDVTITVKKEF
jgi:hypothetical protein|tara:strand:+ start:6011 stop:6175 length:165 start_codon:yes stop_codon:yes gene_type:complete